MLSKELSIILNEAEEIINSDVRGELILPIRRKIWKCLGLHQSEINSNNICIGAKRRTKLAALCVRKVMDIWNKVAEDDNRPLEMIELAEKYIEGSVNYSYVYKRWNDFITDLINLISDESFFMLLKWDLHLFIRFI